MPTTYQFFGEDSGLPYDAPYFVMRKYIDVAVLVANPQLLALATTPTTPLSTFAGFAGASSDILQVFHIPAGTVVTNMGIYVITADTASTTTVSLGEATDPNGFGAAYTLSSSGGFQMTLDDDAYGSDNFNGIVYTAAETLDLTFGTATAIDCKMHIWAEAYKAFDITDALSKPG